MRKWTVLILTIILTALLISCAIAQTDSGERGGVAWTYENGVLTLKGEGPLRSDDTWTKYMKKAKQLVLEGSFPDRVNWDVLSHFPALTKVIYNTDFCWSSFQGKKIKEAVYTSENPVFIGGAYFLSRLETITFENPEADYLQEGNLLFNRAKTTLYYYLGTKAEDVVVPEGIEIIGEGAFANSKIKSIQLPSTLKEIRSEAFYRCAIKSVTIPASCCRIGESAFRGCTALKEIVFQGDHMEFSAEEYTSDGSWFRGGFTFAECTALKEISLPSSDLIESSMFLGCKNLEKVAFGEETKQISSSQLFLNCKKLKAVYIPDDAEFDSQIIPNIKKTKILCHEGSSTEEKAKYYGLNYEAVSSD